MTGDKGIYRWPPHFNLLYPFLPPADFAEAVSLLAPALEGIEDFEVTLDELGVFGGRARGILYCHASSPAETERLCELQAALQDALPFCSEQRRQGVFSAARRSPNSVPIALALSPSYARSGTRAAVTLHLNPGHPHRFQRRT